MKKLISIILVVGVLVLAIVSFVMYQKAFVANTNFETNEQAVFIPTNATYEEAKAIIKPYVKDMDNFLFVAASRNYESKVKAGKFIFKKGMSNYEMVRALRQNIPIRVSFNNQETIENLAERLASQLEPTKEEFLKTFTNEEFLKENNFDSENVLSLFLPNTYEFYWDTSSLKVANKMAKEYNSFWNDGRRMKASSINLTPAEVAVLASIVHKESIKNDERPIIAGVYLNRMQTGMPLQADPTVIYAMKKNAGDFNQVIKRVYTKDIQAAVSPYNTYLNAGLPPGPIAMPDIAAIDAVLNAPKHDYIYFCASPDNPGYHAFASNYEAHRVNARKYSAWVEKLGINR